MILRKKLAVALAVSTCFVNLAHADYPVVKIDSEIVLNYGRYIELSGAVNVPSKVNVPEEANVSVNQFNHNSPVHANGTVKLNEGLDDTTINVTAVGNNASIEVDKNIDPVIGAVQGNQNGGASAVAVMNRNVINQDAIVEVDATAVGNNLSIIDPQNGPVTVGSVQFNYESPVSAYGSISFNGFGVPANPRDPALSVTAVGNNLSSVAPTTGSMVQINRNSPVTAVGTIFGNLGGTSIVTLDATAVGNNISISSPDVAVGK